MRETHKAQSPLTSQFTEHEHIKELEAMSRVLDAHPEVLAWVQADLSAGVRQDTGRDGLTAEQVLRAALVRQLHSLSYRMLGFHLCDSMSFRRFVRLGLNQRPSFTTWQQNIKKLTPQTWENLNRVLVRSANAEGMEPGRKVRTDATVVESPIHHPTDNSLLWDCVRVVTRLLVSLALICPAYDRLFRDHRRRAKRRHLEISQPKGKKKDKKRERAYKDLLDVSDWCYGYGRAVLEKLEALADIPGEALIEAMRIKDELSQHLELMNRVIKQTKSRVVHGVQVPAEKKVFSIFEPHTDIIIKKRREIQYGHKITVSTGASGLVLDCVVEGGNPADSTVVLRTIERVSDILGFTPKQWSLDGGYASKKNVEDAKKKGVEDIAFQKKRGLKIVDMARSSWVYKKLRDFRAGVEGNISMLKRVFGLGRAMWRGLESFKSYVWNGVVAYNLLAMARHQIAES